MSRKKVSRPGSRKKLSVLHCNYPIGQQADTADGKTRPGRFFVPAQDAVSCAEVVDRNTAVVVYDSCV